jgi:hypothetical protein
VIPEENFISVVCNLPYCFLSRTCGSPPYIKVGSPISVERVLGVCSCKVRFGPVRLNTLRIAW